MKRKNDLSSQCLRDFSARYSSGILFSLFSHKQMAMRLELAERYSSATIFSCNGDARYIVPRVAGNVRKRSKNAENVQLKARTHTRLG